MVEKISSSKEASSAEQEAQGYIDAAKVSEQIRDQRIAQLRAEALAAGVSAEVVNASPIEGLTTQGTDSDRANSGIRNAHGSRPDSGDRDTRRPDRDDRRGERGDRGDRHDRPERRDHHAAETPAMVLSREAARTLAELRNEKDPLTRRDMLDAYKLTLEKIAELERGKTNALYDPHLPGDTYSRHSVGPLVQPPHRDAPAPHDDAVRAQNPHIIDAVHRTDVAPVPKPEAKIEKVVAPAATVAAAKEAAKATADTHTATHSPAVAAVHAPAVHEAKKKGFWNFVKLALIGAAAGSLSSIFIAPYIIAALGLATAQTTIAAGVVTGLTGAFSAGVARHRYEKGTFKGVLSMEGALNPVSLIAGGIMGGFWQSPLGLDVRQTIVSNVSSMWPAGWVLPIPFTGSSGTATHAALMTELAAIKGQNGQLIAEIGQLKTKLGALEALTERLGNQSAARDATIREQLARLLGEVEHLKRTGGPRNPAVYLLECRCRALSEMCTPTHGHTWVPIDPVPTGRARMGLLETFLQGRSFRAPENALDALLGAPRGYNGQNAVHGAMWEVVFKDRDLTAHLLSLNPDSMHMRGGSFEHYSRHIADNGLIDFSVLLEPNPKGRGTVLDAMQEAARRRGAGPQVMRAFDQLRAQIAPSKGSIVSNIRIHR